MKKIILILAVILLTGCASSVYNARTYVCSCSDGKVGLLILRNSTEVPFAGMRATGILKGVLEDRDFSVALIPTGSAGDEYPIGRTRAFIEKASEEGIQLLFVGQVNEWRYKTGIDGEPAVSLYLALIDTNNGRVVWSGTGAKSGWGHQSIGTVAQQVMGRLLVALKISKKVQ